MVQLPVTWLFCSSVSPIAGSHRPARPRRPIRASRARFAGWRSAGSEEQHHRQHQEDGFVGPRQQVDARDPGPAGCVAPAAACAQPRQRAEHQAAGRGGHGAAPVAVHPLVQRAEFHHRQHPAGQRPTRRGPAAQHPVAQRAEGRGGQHHSRPGMCRKCVQPSASASPCPIG